MEQYADEGIYILAPIVVDRKGHYRELFEQMRRRGFLHAYIDGEVCELTPGMRLNRFSIHYVSVVVDKCSVRESNKQRITEAVSIAMKLGEGVIDVMRRDSTCLLYTSPSPRDRTRSRMPSSA